MRERKIVLGEVKVIKCPKCNGINVTLKEGKLYCKDCNVYKVSRKIRRK